VVGIEDFMEWTDRRGRLIRPFAFFQKELGKICKKMKFDLAETAVMPSWNLQKEIT